jgi:PQQ-dependent dehydrogenase (methanol/ethanol family)
MSRPICTRWTSTSTLLIALAACGDAKHEQAAAPPAGPAAGRAARIRLVGDPPSGEWRLPAGDLANTRYSPLAQLTHDNVSKLKIVNVVQTGIARGHEGQPLVVGSMMYSVTPYPDHLIALDLATGGARAWLFRPHPDPRAVGIACCDVVNRGASFADGKIIYSLLDDEVVAVDARTGTEAWRTKVGDVTRGETLTAAAFAVGDLVYIGNSGGELGVRGKIIALDVHDGHEVWRAYNTGPDDEVLIDADSKMFYAHDRGKDLGKTTWPTDQWKLGGATVWGWISYDPETDTLYYATGNPGVWNPDVRPGDNKWSCAIIARDPKTGHVKWATQLIPHDMWDYDEIMENIVVDMEWKGQMRKLLIHPGRGGFVLLLDRTTGEILSAEKFEPSTNWASGYDLKTGRPLVDPAKMTRTGQVVKDICPAAVGAKEFNPSAISPRTGMLYIAAQNNCMEYTPEEANYIAGTPYLGSQTAMYPGPGDYQGELIGWDLATQRRVFSVKEAALPLNGGVLATGGDLVFYGTMDGTFRAIDARTGEILWQQKLGSGIVANPMTYLGPDGKQYVAIYAGVGGWQGSVAFPEISEDDPYAGLGVVGAMKQIKKFTSAGDALYVFGL